MKTKIQKLSSLIWNIKNSQAYPIILTIGLLLYFKSLFFDFTYLDDNTLILNNLPFLQKAGNFFTAFTQQVFQVAHGNSVYYRPLLTVSLMPDAMLGGASPFFYHLTNIVIHLIAACLVYKLITKLKYPNGAAFLLSLIFVTHPALTHAVSWIPGRNDSLLTVFILASFIFFLNYLENRKNSQIFWSVLFFLLALLTKETALALPVVCFVYFRTYAFA